ncbi:uncharacterized protein LY89DRAFT_751497 [Mollisia scopiformis]|uniref:Uncharacterized protein n=1 Tax=Mollisia scopiformis TaxID=149040 RepID=A0A194X488_MOLSC|nr:uncharacterized protein LY89DRAFT_751497 [Mollisia scopiformis]KUJ14874.1 hypothetical protein LY89DRAFT_751497 [Mollisia scopiformis]
MSSQSSATPVSNDGDIAPQSPLPRPLNVSTWTKGRVFLWPSAVIESDESVATSSGGQLHGSSKTILYNGDHSIAAVFIPDSRKRSRLDYNEDTDEEDSEYEDIEEMKRKSNSGRNRTGPSSTRKQPRARASANPTSSAISTAPVAPATSTAPVTKKPKHISMFRWTQNEIDYLFDQIETYMKQLRRKLSNSEWIAIADAMNLHFRQQGGVIAGDKLATGESAPEDRAYPQRSAHTVRTYATNPDHKIGFAIYDRLCKKYVAGYTTPKSKAV